MEEPVADQSTAHQPAERGARPHPLLDLTRRGAQQAAPGGQLFLAAALPPLRPAFFFCALVPPWELSPPEPLFLPPRCDAPSLLAIRAARCFDIPLSLSASYCFSFFTFADLLGIVPPFVYSSVPGCSRVMSDSPAHAPDHALSPVLAVAGLPTFESGTGDSAGSAHRAPGEGCSGDPRSRARTDDRRATAGPGHPEPQPVLGAGLGVRAEARRPAGARGARPLG